MTRVLVTGGTGFVGAALVSKLLTNDQVMVAAVFRRRQAIRPNCVSFYSVESIDEQSRWEAALCGVNVVVHTAARVHVMRDCTAEPLAEFRKVNVEGTLNLARQAAAAGVRRFVFISSIKVNGENTLLGRPFTVNDSPQPSDHYGRSKWEAEQGLQVLAAQTGMEVVIIRPVLIYGPGVKANFLNMMKWVNKGLPLPFGAIRNARSLVALDNVVDLIVSCILHPDAANHVFLVSDGEDLSTTELLKRIACSLGKPARLLPIPMGWIDRAARLFGREVIAQRLCGSLQVDITKTRELLGWKPPVSVDEALFKTAQYFLEHQCK